MGFDRVHGAARALRDPLVEGPPRAVPDDLPVGRRQGADVALDWRVEGIEDERARRGVSDVERDHVGSFDAIGSTACSTVGAAYLMVRVTRVARTAIALVRVFVRDGVKRTW